MGGTTVAPLIQPQEAKFELELAEASDQKAQDGVAGSGGLLMVGTVIMHKY